MATTVKRRMFALGCAWAWATFRSQFFNKRDPVCIIPLSSPLAPSACGDETTCADPRLQEQTWWHVQGSLPDDEAIEYTAEGNLRWEQQETRPTCCRLESRRSSCVRFPPRCLHSVSEISPKTDHPVPFVSFLQRRTRKRT